MSVFSSDPQSHVFQSTCPMRGTTTAAADRIVPIPISIHVPHAGHDEIPGDYQGIYQISIHVLHAGHDSMVSFFVPFAPFQSTCPMRGTTTMSFFGNSSMLFQSTCPMRGTTQIVQIFMDYVHFNPRAPCGARPHPLNLVTGFNISIHVPHAGHDGSLLG